MSDQPKKIPCCTGLFAHVDAGKTTLSEALLYCSGAKRTLGRVDHGDAFLDTHTLERRRGITIFSKPARFSTPSREITLVDTPGHVDFSAETERVMGVLDCAILLISGTDGVQAHTVTLWQLLQRYHIPTFLFINKMDLSGANREQLLSQLQRELSAGCMDFGQPAQALAEQCALCDEALLESYLSSGMVTPGQVRELIAARQIFPCLFGSALKLQGVDALLALLDAYAPQPEYGRDFGAKVYKISRDSQGVRLTWLKITGGSLRPRSSLCYANQKGDRLEEKVQQLRLYSGEKYSLCSEASAGQLCAVAGLSQTWAGQGLGTEADSARPLTEPVMTYRVCLPKDADPLQALEKLRLLEEEDPMLRVAWDEQLKEIHAQIMGKIQIEILRSLLLERFQLDVTLDSGRVFYKETIASRVEGVGHFEPLRHYAEVHLLLEPGEPGSGLRFASRCPTDVLDVQYQNLVLTHLAEKQHRGVLTGAPITDMKITLLTGRAHLKHTEGGDFRQATYRAVRQGLMQAESVLLEPWYRFQLTIPAHLAGRAITDIREKSGEIHPPEQRGEFAVLQGTVPAAALGDYAQEVAAYTQGRGRLQLTPAGYAPCHNQQAVVESLGYDPEADLENTPDSVFCGHGAGFTVKWRDVPEYMHLESGLAAPRPALLPQNLHPDDKALEAILAKEFGHRPRELYRPAEKRPVEETLTIRPPKQQYLIVDGYNILFAWQELADTAKHDLSAARRRLLDTLSSYAGFKKCRLVVVFDGYKVPGNPGEKETFHNIQVVYTKENETADAYMEALIAKAGGNYNLRLATSDSLVQLSSLRSGVLRMSARELQEEVALAQQEMRRYYRGK